METSMDGEVWTLTILRWFNEDLKTTIKKIIMMIRLTNYE
jgi:hypothetical protein